MLTMLAYVRYAARPVLWRYLLMTVVFTLGLMAKPMLVTLPCALLLLDFWPLYRFQWFRERWFKREALPAGDHPAFQTASTIRLTIEKIPLLILSFAAIALSFISLQKNSHITSDVLQPMGLRIANALVSYWHYLWKMVWPTNLAIFYPFPKEIPLWQPIAAGIALIAAAGLVIAHSREKPYLATGWFWYLGTLAPVIGIIQGGMWPQIADRWAYIPYIGLFALIGWGFPDLMGKSPMQRRIVTGMAIAILTIFAGLAHIQLTHWKDNKNIFYHTLNVTEDNFLAYWEIGRLFSAEGKHEEAVRHFQAALKISPFYIKALMSLGDEYVLMKDPEAALKAYRKILYLDPSETSAYNNIGKAYILKGSYDQAVDYFQEAVTVSPNDPVGYNNLGVAYLYMGDSTAARQNLEKAISLQPDYAEAFYNLGLVASKNRRYRPIHGPFSKGRISGPEQ